MDELRIEGESYFLDFLPDMHSVKKPCGNGIRNWIFWISDISPAGMPAGIDYQTNDPKREFIERLVKEHIRKDTGITFDPYNYLAADEAYPSLPEHYQTPKDYLQGFRAVSAPGTAFFEIY